MFKKEIEVRWNDLDANQHVTHTAYATFATHARVSWMDYIGCSIVKLLDLGFNAILLKEHTEYYREIFLGEKVTVHILFAGASPDNSRWKFIHEIHKSDGKLAAVNTVYGAWLSTVTRKIAVPPKEFLDLIQNVPRTDDFEIIVSTTKSN